MHLAAPLCLAAALGVVSAAFATPAVHRQGTPRPDVLRGTLADDVLDGRGGADVLIGYGDRDRLIGRRGNDVLVGEPGGDLLLAGAGRDRVEARDSAGPPCKLRIRSVAAATDYPACTDIVLAGPGDDTILMRDRRLDVIWFCGRGRDTVVADRGAFIAGGCEIVRRR